MNREKNAQTINAIPISVTIILTEKRIKNIVRIYAQKHHQKLIPVTKDAIAIMVSLKIHLIGNLFNVSFIVPN